MPRVTHVSRHARRAITTKEHQAEKENHKSSFRAFVRRETPWCRVEIQEEVVCRPASDQTGIGLRPQENSFTHLSPNPFLFFEYRHVVLDRVPFGTRGDSCRVLHWYIFSWSEQPGSVRNDMYWMLTAEPGVRVAMSGPETLQVGAWD